MTGVQTCALPILFAFTCTSEGSSYSPPLTFEVLALVLFCRTHLGQSQLRCPDCLQVKHFLVFINSVHSSVVNCQACVRSTSIAFGSLAFGRYDWKACCHCSFIFLQGFVCHPSKLDWTSRYFCWYLCVRCTQSVHVTGSSGLLMIAAYSPSTSPCPNLSKMKGVSSLYLVRCARHSNLLIYLSRSPHAMRTSWNLALAHCTLIVSVNTVWNACSTVSYKYSSHRFAPSHNRLISHHTCAVAHS